MKQRLMVLVALLVSLYLIGCTKKEAGEKAMSGEAAGDVVATVNQENITLPMLNEQAKKLSSMYGEYFLQPAGRLEVLEQMVSDAVLMQEVKNKGLDKDPSISKELEEYKQQMEDQVVRYKEHLLKNKLLEKEVAPPKEITDEEAEKYFNEHPDDFADKAKVWAKHILVKNKEDAEQVVAKLKKGADFGALAKESSLDQPTANSGGDLGVLEKGMVYPEMEDTLFRLAVGKVEMVELETGMYKGYYSVIKVDRKEAGKPHPYSEVKDKVKEKMSQEQVRDSYQSYLTELKKRINVVTYPEKVTALPATHPPMGGETIDANSVPDDATHRDFGKAQAAPETVEAAGEQK